MKSERKTDLIPGGTAQETGVPSVSSVPLGEGDYAKMVREHQKEMNDALRRLGLGKKKNSKKPSSATGL